MTDPNKWARSRRIQCERTRVDGSKGHVALNWSLCGLQEILNGNDLCLMNNPSPQNPSMNRILIRGGFGRIRTLMKIFPIRKRLVALA